MGLCDQKVGTISMSQIKASLSSPSKSLRTYSEASGKFTPDGMLEFLPYTANGTLSTTFCSGYDKWGIYCNGLGGTYNALIQTNSTDCGYITPPPYIPPTPPPPVPPTWYSYLVSYNCCTADYTLCSAVKSITLYSTSTSLNIGAYVCTSHSTYSCGTAPIDGYYSDGSYYVYVQSGLIDSQRTICPSPPPTPPTPPPATRYNCKGPITGCLPSSSGTYADYNTCVQNCPQA